jgi:hypothetical protein
VFSTEYLNITVCPTEASSSPISIDSFREISLIVFAMTIISISLLPKQEHLSSPIVTLTLTLSGRFTSGAVQLMILLSLASKVPSVALQAYE